MPVEECAKVKVHLVFHHNFSDSLQIFWGNMVDLDIEVFDVVVLARSGKAPVEHGPVRRKFLMMRKCFASAQNRGSGSGLKAC